MHKIRNTKNIVNKLQMSYNLVNITERLDEVEYFDANFMEQMMGD